jgi:pilus assembly protein CpaB
MRVKSFVVTLIGLGIAGGSVYMAREVLLAPIGASASEPAMVDVVVARAPIGFGQAIEGHLIATQPWPADSLPDGAFTEMAALLAHNPSDVRRARAPLFAGEVLLASKLSAPGEKVTIVQKLGENTRAMAIKVDAVTAVGGFVTPGDYVDILMTQGQSGALSTVTILQNIRVIGVDQTAEEQTNTPEIAQTVTVEVTPEDGQKLALAQKAGTLSLTLRTLDNVVDQPLQMIEITDLLQKESPVEEVKKKRTVVVRRGTVGELVELN